MKSVTGKVVPIKPIVSYLKIPENSQPYIEGYRCGNCGEIFIGQRSSCSRCLETGGLSPIRLSDTGKLYNWTIVYRNFPNVKVPFVSAIIDLDGGGTVKATLVDVATSPAAISFDMRVKLVCRELEQTDQDGNRYLGYFFAPHA